MYAQVSEPPPPLTLAAARDLPAAVDRVRRALAKAPGDRYTTCREFADALREAFGLVSYDSGPEPIPAAHPPAVEYPPSVVHPPSGRPARRAPAGRARPAHQRGRRARARPAGSPRSPRAVRPPAAFGHPGPARQGRSRRAILAALAAVLVLAAAAIGAYVLHGRLSGRPLATIPIAAASAIAPVSGDEYVIYRAGQNASARVHGEVRHVIRGETAELFAQPFPYRHAPVPVGSVVLETSRSGAAYAFTVTPSLATRYYAELFGSSSATTPLARSRTVTIYVTRDVAGGRARKCGNPLCPPSVHMHVWCRPRRWARSSRSAGTPTSRRPPARR